MITNLFIHLRIPRILAKPLPHPGPTVGVGMFRTHTVPACTELTTHRDTSERPSVLDRNEIRKRGQELLLGKLHYFSTAAKDGTLGREHLQEELKTGRQQGVQTSGAQGAARAKDNFLSHVPFSLCSLKLSDGLPPVIDYSATHNDNSLPGTFLKISQPLIVYFAISDRVIYFSSISSSCKQTHF